jgi:hypothetical protein
VQVLVRRTSLGAEQRPEITCTYKDGQIVRAHFTRVHGLDRTALRPAK